MRALGASRTSLVPGGVLAGPWVRDPLWRRARAVPSLDLRFADNKSLTDAVTGASLVTFTRASSGTYTDSAGVIQTAATDVPRFDHNPTTGESLGLLVEEQRVNLITSSSDIAGFFTEQNSTATADAAAAPDGTVTADLLVPNTSPSSHTSFNASISFSASTTYSYSIFVKPNGYSWLQLLFTGGFDNPTAWVNFDLTGAGSFGFTGGGEISKEIESYPGGWYRCTITATSGAAAAGGPAYLVLDSNRNGRDANYAGDNTSGIYLWGAQLEAGAFATSYIPTTTAAVTRAADVASISGSNFSSWYRQDEGTMFADWSTSSPIEQAAWTLSNGTVEESLRVATLVPLLSNNTRLVAIDGNSLQAGLIVGVYTPGSQRRTAFAYQQDNFAGVTDGEAIVTDTSGTLPTVDRLFIGTNWAGSGAFLGGHLRRLTYWPQRLANSTLQQITQ